MDLSTLLDSSTTHIILQPHRLWSSVVPLGTCIVLLVVSLIIDTCSSEFSQSILELSV